MSKKMLNIKINNIPLQVEEGTTVLEAAKKAKIKIPTLCYLKKINAIGACRMCLVEIKGVPRLMASCVYPCFDGMEVFTHTDKVNKSRKMTLELLLSNHKTECLSCDASTKCYLQQLAYEYNCYAKRFVGDKSSDKDQDYSSNCISRDNSKCVLCQRCVSVCRNVQNVDVIGINKRGFESHVGCSFNNKINKTGCVGCGQCTLVCPTGALMEKDDTYKVVKALNDPDIITVVAPAPSARVGLGEEFGMPIGTNVTDILPTALRQIGFDHVFDIDFGADLTITEEANEFVQRIKNNGVLPMFTSCCPA